MLPPERERDIWAGWQSGHAADCNSVYAGSIPTSASTYHRFIDCPDGEIGRHKRLKISRPQGRAGSIPARGTINSSSETHPNSQKLALTPSLASVLVIYDYATAPADLA